MRVRTDDEVYRVDAVWLGPPKATFPWRARYVAWGVGILVFLLVVSGEKVLGLGFGFFTLAWAMILTVVLTRLICSRINSERPLGAVFTMWTRELTTPRETTAGVGGAASATRIRIRSQRPRPRSRSVPRRVKPPGQPARPVQQIHYVQHAQGWPDQPAPTHRRARAVRPRSKEVGGVRTPGRP